MMGEGLFPQSLPREPQDRLVELRGGGLRVLCPSIFKGFMAGQGIFPLEKEDSRAQGSRGSLDPS